MIAARVAFGGALYMFLKLVVAKAANLGKVFIVSPCSSASYQIVFIDLRPFVNFWWNLVLSSPSLSKMALLLIRQLSSLSLSI